MKVEAKAGVMLPKAKEYMGPPEAERDEEWSSTSLWYFVMATQANEHNWLEPLPWLMCLLPTFPVTIPQTIRGSELKDKNPREQD